MTMSKSEHAKKRVEFYKGKVTYFKNLLAAWEDRYEEAKRDEVAMATGKLNGQIEIEGSTNVEEM